MIDYLHFSGEFNKSHLSYLAEPQLLYAYFEARPAAAAATTHLPLNFSLVLDRSGSMSGEKIKQLREAVRAMIGRLEPADIISMVAFNAHTDVIIPATPARDREALTSRVARLEAGGGTTMAPAIRAGLAEIAGYLSPERASRLIVLTDGQTTGEDDCRAAADEAAAAGVPLVALGLGTDWNEDLLIDLVGRTGSLGDAFLIREPEDVGPIFKQVFTQMQVFARDVAVDLRLVKGVEARRVWQVTPSINDITGKSIDGLAVRLGVQELAESGAAFLVELRIPPRSPGIYRFARAMVNYRLPEYAETVQEPVIDLTAEVTAASDRPIQINDRVMSVVEKVTAYSLQTQALDDAARQDIANATRKLRSASTILLQQGEVELAQNALAEADRLESGQGLSSEGRKTIRLSGGKTVRLIRPVGSPTAWN